MNSLIKCDIPALELDRASRQVTQVVSRIRPTLFSALRRRGQQAGDRLKRKRHPMSHKFRR